MTNELGTFWFYEGASFGFRALHIHFPDSGLIIAVTLNSRPDEDQSGALVTSVYETLLEHEVVQPAPAPAGA